MTAADGKGTTSRVAVGVGQGPNIKTIHEGKRGSVQGGSNKEWGLSDMEKA